MSPSSTYSSPKQITQTPSSSSFLQDHLIASQSSRCLSESLSRSRFQRPRESASVPSNRNPLRDDVVPLENIRKLPTLKTLPVSPYPSLTSSCFSFPPPPPRAKRKKKKKESGFLRPPPTSQFPANGNLFRFFGVSAFPYIISNGTQLHLVISALQPTPRAPSPGNENQPPGP